MEQDEIFRSAAIKLKAVRNAISNYNELAFEHHLYAMELGSTPDLQMAESGIPREILRDVYEKR